MTVILKGKDRDIKLAETIRATFVEVYNDESKFEELLADLGSNTLDKLIHRLNTTKKIQLYRDYNDLKEIAQEVLTHCGKEVFLEACKIEDARVWINNKGKYKEIAFDSLYRVFEQNEKLKALIEK